jgi:hypothetical protein
MWVGIVDDCLVGPHVLPHRLTGNRYRDFHLHDLAKLLEEVPLAVRGQMWYVHDVHDSASVHFSSAVRDILSNTIMTDGQVEEGPLHGLHAHQT